ncbi:MAG: hypothetical protein B7Z31_12545 [Rhodobacterales bacterium 12-65-15]|nr:MAG: hypothetical protein B7Z31_12545 [Rhodobacterales bacterium 12-65-15]
MLVPELTVADPKAAAAMLARFGFAEGAGLWRLGSQALRLVQAAPGGHGRIDHIALSVPDIDAALAALMGQGLALDADVTPDGIGSIPEFWQDGLRYVYLSGPEGARIELCQRVSGAATLIGHDHIGIPCASLAGMQAFFEAAGARLVASVDLIRADGLIPVRFLDYAGGMIELYQPPSVPANRNRATPGLWSRLLVPGLPAALHGPEGLTLAPL